MRNPNQPLMNKIPMNHNHRPSFHFNRHKIFLVIRRQRPVKGNPLFTSNHPSNKPICKQHKIEHQITPNICQVFFFFCPQRVITPHFFKIQLFQGMAFSNNSTFEKLKNNLYQTGWGKRLHRSKNFTFLRPRNSPKATIRYCCIFKCKPQPGTCWWFGIKK